MKELTENKKLEVLKLFLEGYSYEDIASNCDVAKGTVVNVVNDLRSGRFPEFSEISDLVDSLRQISIELKRNNAGVSEALLGLAFFSRLDGMGVKPPDVWTWTEMCRSLTSPEANQEEFMTAALEIFRLKQETGESYPELAARCSEIRTEVERLQSDVKQLRNEKKELESTDATLAEDQKKIIKEKEGLQRDIGQLSSKHEQLRQEVTELDNKHSLLSDEIKELETTVEDLRPEVNKLEGLGFSKSELMTLRVELEEMASSQHLMPEALKTKFFQDLVEYGAIIGFDKKKEELEREVATLRTQKQSLDKIMSKLGLPTEEAEETVKCLASLKKKGVMPSTIASYSRILSQFGLEPDELEREVLELGGLEKTVALRREEIKKLDQEEHEHTGVVESLRAEENKIKTTINELKESGVKEITDVSLAVTQELENVDDTFLADLEKWGNLKAEIGKYESELKLARYFGKLPMSTEAEQSLIEELPALVVSQYLSVALAWCRKKFNPKLRPPRFIKDKYYQISEYTNVELADLLIWALGVLTEGGAYGNK